MQIITETSFLRAWRQHPQLPVEAAYEQMIAGTLPASEYQKHLAKQDAELQAMRLSQARRAVR